jgi:murein DD-endopeptidase MepM/ murein hydrolase activator NlpD
VLVFVLTAGLLAPGRSAWIFVAPAGAELVPTPLPTLPPIFDEDPEPSPSPSNGPGGGSGGSGGGRPNGGGGGGHDRPAEDGERGHGARDRRSGPVDPRLAQILATYNPSGVSYDTDRLLRIAAQLRGFGWSAGRVLRAVFPPFIVAGRAYFTDTWGAPRFGPGDLVRRHEGQDVFCSFGAPVLAAESGRIQFDRGELGGKVARLFRPDRSYWYYAHLAGHNPDLSSGDRVRRGDVIGYCGNSGNALTTPPHVHFGWYGSDEVARDPIGHLARWLAQAEHRAGRALNRARGARLASIDGLEARRRFGDAFIARPARGQVADELAATLELLQPAGLLVSGISALRDPALAD